jgi:hypothetical protein
LEIDGRRIGIRWSASGLAAGVQKLIGPNLIDGDSPPNVSVVVGSREGGVTAKHRLHVQGKLVVVTASDERLHRAVVRAVADLASAGPDGTLALRATVVVDADGQAILVDRRLGYDLWNLDRRLRLKDCRTIDTASVNVDVATGSVLLTDVASVVDHAATPDATSSQLAGLDDLRGGSMPISRVVFSGTSDGGRLAERLAEAAPMTAQPDYSLRIADIEDLLVLFRHIASRSVRAGDAGALLAALDLSPR